MRPLTTSHTSRPGVWQTAIAVTFVIGAGLPMVQAYPAADIGWLVHVTARVLDGAVLYVDILENRPPALFLFAASPVTAGRLIGIDPTHVYHLWVSGFVAASLFLCATVSRETLFDGQPVTRHVFLLGAALLLTVVALHHYGQPGHLVGALTLPYLLSAARRASGQPVAKPMAVAIGMLAGLGIALKPFYVIPWLCIELYVRLRTRDPRSLLAFENLAIAAVQVLFLGTVLLAFPRYISDVLPLVISLFNAHNAPLVALLFRAVLGGLLLCIPLYFGLGREALQNDLRRVLLIAAGAFLAVFLIQQKGWGHHLYPSLCFAFLLSIVLIAGYWERMARAAQPIRGRPLLALTLAVSILYPAGLGIGAPVFPPTFFVRLDNPGYRQLLEDLSAMIRREAPGGTIFVFSASALPAFHLISRDRARWPYKLWSLWPLPGLYPAPDGATGRHIYRPLDAQPPAERRIFETIVSDIAGDPPGVLIVDAGAPKHGWIRPQGDGGFDYLDYFGRDPRFAGVFRNYEELPPVARFRVFRRR